MPAFFGDEQADFQIEDLLVKFDPFTKESDGLLERIALLTHDRLLKLASGMLRRYPTLQGTMEAEDLLHETHARLYKALVNERPQTARHAFCLASRHIGWRLLELARKGDSARRPQRSDFPEEPVDPSGGPPEILLRAEVLEHVAKLPELERQVIELLYFQGSTQEEAASILDVTSRTVRNYLTNAMNLLREQLSNAEDET
jgi:RNA polymerase sigma factor (sigma-70 family)